VVAVAVAISVGYFALVAPAQVRQRVTDYSTSSSSGRSDSWQIAWKIAQAHPIHGVALGGYRDAQLKYVASSIDVQYVGQILNDRLVVHNTYLETLAELGIVGFGLFGGTLVLALGIGLRTSRQVRATDANALRGLVAGSCGMLAAFFFVSAEYEKPMWIAVALLAASPVLRKDVEPAR
jgi:O-antigen ligase